jgi:hypothetical protein
MTVDDLYGLVLKGLDRFWIEPIIAVSESL